MGVQENWGNWMEKLVLKSLETVNVSRENKYLIHYPMPPSVWDHDVPQIQALWQTQSLIFTSPYLTNCWELPWLPCLSGASLFLFCLTWPGGHTARGWGRAHSRKQGGFHAEEGRKACRMWHQAAGSPLWKLGLSLIAFIFIFLVINNVKQRSLSPQYISKSWQEKSLQWQIILKFKIWSSWPKEEYQVGVKMTDTGEEWRGRQLQ